MRVEHFVIRFSFALALILIPPQRAEAVANTWSLVATDWSGDRLLRIDPTSHAVTPITTNGAGGLDNPAGITMHPSGDLLVSSGGTNNIRRFDSGTGAYKGVFASGIPIPIGAKTGPNGNLYFASRDGNGVFSYQPTGASAGQYILNNTSILWWAFDVEFMPDGDLLVSSFERGAILRFDGTTHAFESVFSFASTGYAAGLARGPNGDIFVARYNANRIDRLDGVTGALKGTFATGNGMNKPSGLCFAPDGQLYVANERSSTISVFSASHGQALSQIVTSADPQAGTQFIAIVPEPSGLGILGGAFLAGMRRRKRSAHRGCHTEPEK